MVVSGGYFFSNNDIRRCFLWCLHVSSNSSLLFNIVLWSAVRILNKKKNTKGIRLLFVKIHDALICFRDFVTFSDYFHFEMGQKSGNRNRVYIQNSKIFLIVLTQKLSLTLKWQKQPLDGTISNQLLKFIRNWQLQHILYPWCTSYNSCQSCIHFGVFYHFQETYTYRISLNKVRGH